VRNPSLNPGTSGLGGEKEQVGWWVILHCALILRWERWAEDRFAGGARYDVDLTYITPRGGFS
jgi:hypothetical protein